MVHRTAVSKPIPPGSAQGLPFYWDNTYSYNITIWKTARCHTYAICVKVNCFVRHASHEADLHYNCLLSSTFSFDGIIYVFFHFQI